MLIVRWILSISVLLIVVGGIVAATLGCIQAIEGLKSHAVDSPGAVLGVVGASAIGLGGIAITILNKLKLLVF